MIGEEQYKNFLREYDKTLKLITFIDEEKEQKAKEEELIAKRRAKAAQKKAKRQENRRKRRITEMKEAIVAALKEHDGDKNFYSYFGVPEGELHTLFEKTTCSEVNSCGEE